MPIDKFRNTKPIDNDRLTKKYKVGSLNLNFNG